MRETTRCARNDLALVFLFSVLVIAIIALLCPTGASAVTTVSVKDFGAKGDGTTNDSAAIQSAVRVAGEKTVFFPAGTYIFANVRVPSGTALLFEAGARAVGAGGGGDHFFLAEGSETSRLSGISLTGGTFDGRGMFSVLKTISVNGVSATGVRAMDVTSTVSANLCDDVDVDRCEHVTGLIGYCFTTCTDVKVANSKASDMSQDGILFYKRSDGLVATGNTFDGYCTSHVSGRGGIQVYGSTDATITGNTVLNGEYDSVGIRFRDSNGFWCAENYVESPGKYGLAVSRIGDYPGLDGGDGTFARNTVVKANVRGIQAAYVESEPIRVFDNVIRATQDTLSNDPAAGMRIRIPGSVVVGNVIEDTEGNGIEIGGDRVVAVRNKVTNLVKASKVGVWVDGTNASVVQNSITDSGGQMVSAVKLYTGSSAVVKDNTVSGYTGSGYVFQGTRLSAVGGDSIAPTASHTQAQASGVVSVTIKATDAGSGIKAVTYGIDGGAKVTVPGPQVTLTMPASITHTITYSAIDGAGNASAFVTASTGPTLQPRIRRKVRLTAARTSRVRTVRALALSTLD